MRLTCVGAQSGPVAALSLEWEIKFFTKPAARRAAACLFGCVMTAMLIAASGLTNTASAQQTQISYRPEPLIINNDRGGLLRDRLRQLAHLRQEDRSVQIQGNICYSTCTMFIGLPKACVSPDTTFGFHGPSSYGRALDPATFDAASRRIASHYPCPTGMVYE